MNTKSKTILATAVLAGFLLAGLFMLEGCKKKEAPAPPPTPKPAAAPVKVKQPAEIKETTAALAKAKEDVSATAKTEGAAAVTKAKEAAVAAIEQTTCPVLPAPIDKNVFTEYKGKKVYFCCADCKKIFEMDPEKYVSKLPQFAK